MITELAVERVEFTCGSCWHSWSVDYDVQRYRDALDAEWEVFDRDNTAVPSPYTPQGAPPCEHCGRRWVGRLVARRPVPLPDAEAPRSRVQVEGADRPERHAAPMLHAAGHPKPQPGTRAAKPSTKPSG
ncbi:hypothetical protein [Streptomyces viridosporus]|uniref:hypothetical protein n=1 Tax=Streptomyces viridosporus TaxID=67581 RepID=UPI00331D9B0E